MPIADFSPSPAEQLLLELINQSRMFPEREFDALIRNTAQKLAVQENISSAIRYFGVDLTALQNQLAALQPAAPLAWNLDLSQAAEGHNQAMIVADQQSHQLPGEDPLRERIEAAGYTNWRNLNENVYAYAEDMIYGHAGFVIDWGFDDADFQNGTLLSAWQTLGDGIQDAAGHRAGIMTPSNTEVGIAVTAEGDVSTEVGPFVITQDFGTRFGYQAQLVGVVLADSDGDKFYDIGEGLGGVTVAAQGSAGEFVTESWGSGGYQIILPAGSYTVSFSGGALSGTATYTVVIGTDNVKLDAFAADAINSTMPPGTEGPDALTGTTLDDTIDGLGGDDTILADDGNDVIRGGDGNDFIGGGAGNDAIDGGAGNNTIFGGLGNDTVQGGGAYDEIYGSAGRNQLFGNGGNDFIQAGSGGDFIGGGAGNDTVRGGDGADTVYAGLGNDNVGGGAGNDVIFGSAGANVIYAGFGNDTVQGGSGSDTIFGSAGVNQLFGNDGNDVVYTSAAGDLAAGGAGNDSIFGADGADTIYAGLGDDFIGGGAGNDAIFAGAGANRIYGGVGNDTITAGVGKDVVTGGPGADVFVFASAAAIGIGAARDVITDFTPGVDDIDLRALGTTFNGTAGVLGGGTASFFHFAAGGLLIGDQNGDGAADWVLELSGAPGITAADFLL